VWKLFVCDSRQLLACLLVSYEMVVPRRNDCCSYGQARACTNRILQTRRLSKQPFVKLWEAAAGAWSRPLGRAHAMFHVFLTDTQPILKPAGGNNLYRGLVSRFVQTHAMDLQQCSGGSV
jgi:hypothetical protein